VLEEKLTEPVPVHRHKPPLRRIVCPGRDRKGSAHDVARSAQTVLPPAGLALVPH
jgi:hypothetical protein